MTRVAVASPHPTRRVDLSAGSLAVLDVAPAAVGRDAVGRDAVGRDGVGRDGVTGLPVLLVPGFTGSKEDFTPVVDGLAAGGHRVIALDLPGQWESAGGDDPKAYLPDVLARGLAELSGALKIGRAHLLGHSYGGLVARAAVLQDPRPWASLTLLSSGPGALSDARRSATELLGQAAGAMELDALYDLLLDYWQSHGEVMPSGAAAEFQRARFTGGRAAAIVGMAQGLLEEPDLVDDLAAVAAGASLPLHVVLGDADDAWLPEDQAAMARRLGVEAVVIRGAGHSPAYDTPATLVEVLLRLWRDGSAPGEAG